MRTNTIILAIAALFALCACTTDKNRFVGTWESEQMKDTESEIRETLTFSKDGSARSILAAKCTEYEDGEKMTFSFTMTTRGNWDYANGILELDFDESTTKINLADFKTDDWETNQFLSAVMTDPDMKSAMEEEMKSGIINTNFFSDRNHDVISFNGSAFVISNDGFGKVEYKKKR